MRKAWYFPSSFAILVPWPRTKQCPYSLFFRTPMQWGMLSQAARHLGMYSYKVTKSSCPSPQMIGNLPPSFMNPITSEVKEVMLTSAYGQLPWLTAALPPIFIPIEF